MNLASKLKNLHASQSRQLSDMIIKVNSRDEVIGKIDKLSAHLVSPQNDTPHRAFSIFLFDQNNRLLMQKRSADKLTFPSLWTNSCCSHPSYSTDETIEDNNEGIRRAASRRLAFEFNILTDMNKMHPLRRILYYAKDKTELQEHECE